MWLALVHIFLMFVREPYLPIDILFGTNTADLRGHKGNSTTYIKNLKWRIEWAYKTANEVVKREQERNKWQYYYKVWCAKLEVGDKVLLKHTAFKGKHKIQDQWESTIYEVVQQPLGKLPVFQNQSTEGDDMKVAHRNLLLPLITDPLDETSEQDSESLIDPKETIGTQVVIAVCAIASHVHNLSTCEGAQVTNLFQRGLEYVTALFQKHWDLSGLTRNWI